MINYTYFFWTITVPSITVCTQLGLSVSRIFYSNLLTSKGRTSHYFIFTVCVSAEWFKLCILFEYLNSMDSYQDTFVSFWRPTNTIYINISPHQSGGRNKVGTLVKADLNSQQKSQHGSCVHVKFMVALVHAGKSALILRACTSLQCGRHALALIINMREDITRVVLLI